MSVCRNRPVPETISSPLFSITILKLCCLCQVIVGMDFVMIRNVLIMLLQRSLIAYASSSFQKGHSLTAIGFCQTRNVPRSSSYAPSLVCLELQCNLSQTRMTFRPSTEICKINYRRLADTSRNHSFAAVKPCCLCVTFHLR